MPRFNVLSKSKHSKLRIKITNHMKFAKKDNVCEIYADEVMSCSSFLPIAFIKKNNQNIDLDEKYKLVALCGIIKNKNAFLNEDEIWTGSYIPAIYRTYPFKILNDQNDKERKVLCFDDDNDLFTEKEDNDSSVALFEKNGDPSEHLKKIMQFLSSLENSYLKTQNALKIISDLNLLEEWKIIIKTKDKEIETNGLYQIKKNAIQKLNKEELFSLKNSNGLELIFSHFFSKININHFGHRSPSNIFKDSNKFENDNVLDSGVNIRDLKNEVKLKQEKEKIKEVDNLVKNLLKEE